MSKLKSTLFLFFVVFISFLKAQPVTNKGKEFWVAYPANQLAGQETYHLYLSANTNAIVTVEIPCLNWSKTYSIPAGTVKVSDTIPKLARHDSAGTFCDAIHITSNVSIVAYAHCYGSASSGASLLLPVNTWTTDYQCLTYQEYWGPNSYSNFYFVAKENDTKVLVKPSDDSFHPFFVSLNKGEWYQYTAKDQNDDLTGSVIKVVANNSGVKNPIAFFSCASRTLLTKPCAGGGDFIMQQNFPQNAWGKNYLTAPAAQSKGVPFYQSNLFRIQLQDINTQIWINDTLVYPNPISTPKFIDSNTFINNVINANYLQYLTKKPTYIKSDKPIAVAQYFSGACSGVGDPEMIYLSPLEQGIRKASFYRNDMQNIVSNHVTLVGDAIDTLQLFDGALPKNWTRISPHPNYAGKAIYEADWLTSAKKQVTVIGRKNFTGITYGLGSVESYGYNIGARAGNAYEPNISGFVFYDNNKNGTKEPTESVASFIRVQLNDSNYTFTDLSGYYELPVDSIGNYTIEVKTQSYYNAVPNNINVSVPKLDTLISVNDIALQMQSTHDSLQVTILPAWNSLANDPSTFLVYYQNLGTSVISPNLDFIYDDSKLEYDSCSNSTAQHSSPLIEVNASPMQPGDIGSFIVYLHNKATVQLNDSLKVSVCGSIPGTTISSCDNSYSLVAAPFAKNAAQAPAAISLANVANGKYLDFNLKFRNNTNDKSENVYIVDTLSSLLDPNSVKLVQTSFPCKVVVNGNVVKFTFKKINLPSSSLNSLKSFGFVSFKAKVKTNAVNGDIILNKADVYFDYNDSETTNQTTTKVNLTGVVTPVKVFTFKAVKTEKNVSITINTIEEKDVKQILIQRSFDGKEFKTIALKDPKNGYINEYNYQDAITNEMMNQTTIYYRAVSVDIDGFKQTSNIEAVKFNKEKLVSTYPNPAKNNVLISGNKMQSFTVYNTTGQIIVGKTFGANTSSYNLNISDLNNGIYYLKVQFENGVSETQTLVVKH